MRRCLLLAALSLAFAPAPLPKREREDVKHIQGEWVLTSRKWGGRPEPTEGMRWKFTGAVLTRVIGRDTYRWRFALDPTVSPRALDMQYGQHRTKAIYVIEGDTLTVCHDARDWDRRPKDFSGQGRDEIVQVFKRVRR
jgi:uncharacterized protein (TIGR03067 family)